jgi:hypothetical protein
MAWPALPPIAIPPLHACAQVSAILARNHCLFRHAVAKPDSLRRLFEWLRRDLALPQATIVRLLARCPLILQVGGLGGGWGLDWRGRGGCSTLVFSICCFADFRFLRSPLAAQQQQYRNSRNDCRAFDATSSLAPCPCPLPLLQADVDGVLKGRVQFLLDLDLTLVRGRRLVLPVLHDTSWCCTRWQWSWHCICVRHLHACCDASQSL